MSLVDYSSSEDEASCIKEDETSQLSLKRKIDLPPLPSNFEEEIEENNGCSKRIKESEIEQHQGRVRSFPHQVGNYPSHIFLDVIAKKRMSRFFDTIIQIASKIYGTTIQSILSPSEPNYHISLSRTISLKHHQINPLVDLLQKILKKRINSLSVINNIHSEPNARFTFQVEEYEWLVNDEKTRSFLTLRIATGRETLLSLIQSVDSVLHQYGLPLYYIDPKPHLTIGWILGDITQHTVLLSGTLQSLFDHNDNTLDHSNEKDILIESHGIVCKCGKFKYNIL